MWLLLFTLEGGFLAGAFCAFLRSSSSFGWLQPLSFEGCFYSSANVQLQQLGHFFRGTLRGDDRLRIASNVGGGGGVGLQLAQTCNYVTLLGNGMHQP